MDESAKILWYRDLREHYELDGLPEPKDLEETADYFWCGLKQWRQELIERQYRQEEFYDPFGRERITPRSVNYKDKDGLNVDTLEILAFGHRAWKERKAERMDRVRRLREREGEIPGFRVREDGVLLGCNKRSHSLELPPYVTAIPDHAFKNKDFDRIHIPEGVWLIGRELFSWAWVWDWTVKQVEIPQSVELILSEAFQYVIIQSILLPSSLKLVAGNAFPGSGIEEVHIHCELTAALPVWNYNRKTWEYVNALGVSNMPYLYLYHPQANLTDIPVPFRNALMNSFYRQNREGKVPSDIAKPVFLEKMRRHAVALWRKQDPSIQEMLLRERLLDERAYRAIEKTGVEKPQENPELQAAFLGYRHRVLSGEKLERMESERMKREMRELFRAGRSSAEERKLWRCRERDGNLEILAYRGFEPAETVVVPGRIGKKQVTRIHAMALGEDPEWRESMALQMLGRYEEEEMPYREWIGHTIRECKAHLNVRSAIRKIVIAEGIHTLELEALAACRPVEEMILPESLRIIGPRCFYDCRSLKDLILPAGLKWVGEDAFLGCKSLEVLVVLGRWTRIEISRVVGMEEGFIVVGFSGPVREWAEKLDIFFADLDQSWNSLPQRQREILAAYFARMEQRGQHLPDQFSGWLRESGREVPE